MNSPAQPGGADRSVPQRVLNALEGAKTESLGLSCRALSLAVGAPGREVRYAVTALREGGVPICGTPRTGYFIARTAEELAETLNFLRARAMHSLKIEAGLRRMSLPQLLGQMQMEWENNYGDPGNLF
jgi:hypothetical protein